MGFFGWLIGTKSHEINITISKGYEYERVKEADIPDLVLKQHILRAKTGAETTVHEINHYRYVIGPHECWKRKIERTI